MIYESSLYHHGVEGQRKGVRNGPPYPLKQSAKSSAEKRAEKKALSTPKIGVAKYQNPDGSLTAKGQARYKKDVINNAKQKHKNQLPEEALKDPDRWIREDIESKRDIANESVKVIDQIQRAIREDETEPERMDLSKMTDQELRDKINREQLERQYNKLFNTKAPEVSKGKYYVDHSLGYLKSISALGASALSIALSIKKLKG